MWRALYISQSPTNAAGFRPGCFFKSGVCTSTMFSAECHIADVQYSWGEICIQVSSTLSFRWSTLVTSGKQQWILYITEHVRLHPLLHSCRVSMFHLRISVIVPSAVSRNIPFVSSERGTLPACAESREHVQSGVPAGGHGLHFPQLFGVTAQRQSAHTQSM